MFRFLLVGLISTILCASAFAQAARVKRTPPANPVETTQASGSSQSLPSAPVDAEALYREANEYARNKFTEFEQKKIPYSESVRQNVIRDQRQLAARNAATLGKKPDLAGDEFFYLGMLHWLAENHDGTLAAMTKFLASEKPAPERAQTARSGIAIINARKRDFQASEKYLQEYLAVGPIRLRERNAIELELSKTYREAKEYEKAALHASQAYTISKELLTDGTSRARGLSDILSAARSLHSLYKEVGDGPRTEALLADAIRTGAQVESSSIYYFGIDNTIKFKIESGKKAEAMQFYESAVKSVKTDITSKPLAEDIQARLKKREKHYKMLGETAPELLNVAAWFPSDTKTIAGMKGKVILLDFWATWCGPCFEAFPYLSDLQETYKREGLEVLGVTRFYGEADGMPADEEAEIRSLKKFRLTQSLPYDFVVARGAANHINYGSPSLPTAVIIDRKGVVRYVEAGSGPGREEEIREAVLKLLSEK